MPLAKSQNKENFSQRKYTTRKNDAVSVSFFLFFRKELHFSPYIFVHVHKKC